MEIQVNIREVRQKKNLSQADMAERLNLSLVSYSNIERGITELSVKRLYEIAKILEVPINELLGLEIETPESKEVERLKNRILELEDRIDDKIQSNNRLLSTIGEINSFVELYMSTKARQLKLGTIEYLDDSFNVIKTKTIKQLFEESGNIDEKGEYNRYILTKDDKNLLFKQIFENDWIIDLQRKLYLNGYLHDKDFVEIHKTNIENFVKSVRNRTTKD